MPKSQYNPGPTDETAKIRQSMLEARIRAWSWRVSDD